MAVATTAPSRYFLLQVYQQNKLQQADEQLNEPLARGEIRSRKLQIRNKSI